MTGQSWMHGTKPTDSPHSRTGRYQSSIYSTQTHPLSPDSLTSALQPGEQILDLTPEIPPSRTHTIPGSQTMESITPMCSEMSLPTTTLAPTESAMEIYATSFKPLLRTKEESGRPPKPLSPTSGGLLDSTEQSQNWSASSLIDPSIWSGMSYTEGSRTLHVPYETETSPSPEQEVPTYLRDSSTPYYRSPKTSPSISGLAILQHGNGTTSTHGSEPRSPGSATGSQNQTARRSHPTPDQPLNPIMKKAVIEMDWEELVEWQGKSLANEGAWISTDAAKLMYQPQVPEIV
ncbi:uncharacterized protein EV420DRAFT_1634462 [Desarmillaria tabescens]|uniref:Uncharacterized protein n=1 Tax=Armillaria tabescens TaxID=1929756 RepID=A0AA39NR76_ARMTA|nr:uncharacterized protein EV420DRAFT_1634462 [Desarmillaria tabescens]KAK0470033.1 hypothetical protein EV420DRAFT_1634462 [Desarmillaria tabescens]